MISGGSTDGDSNRARKAKSRRECLEVDGNGRNEPVISFGPEDLRGVSLPHNDALVIQARVANYDVLRVFVDNGSSVNVIFKEALCNLRGKITLPLTLGTGDLRKTVMTVFTVVDAPSSYNIILGRLAMNEMRAVASTYHQKIKFSVRGRVGEVKGDQPSSRRCYGETVRVDQKKAIMEEKGKESQEEVTREREVHFVADEEQEVVEIEPRKHVRKKRHFGPEKDKVIEEQVGELLRAGHIREVQFPTWLSNVILVPKSTGKWRMCVDFRDLNKAYPKDCYPLPRIDQLVDSTSGCELLSFLDVYQGYHQIPLALEDEDKASFITSGGTFCYVVMLFGLKNAGATYQRLMNHVFQRADRPEY
ncbi:uncharacterized protein LOC142504391 [Primulina tabacum]|uniref:uncharacterized protein LOC142504391 n=1 Tax=Primulina tabacum TaxID=48773 RepID=UPI003F5ADB01